MFLCFVPSRLLWRRFVFGLMFLQDVPDGLVDLLIFLGIIFFCPAPFLGGIGRKFAPVDGEHLFSDEPHFIADEKHVPKEGGDLFFHGGDKVGEGREVGLCVGCEGFEEDVVLTAGFNLSAGGDAVGVGKEDDFQQNGGIEGGGAGCIILIKVEKDREVELVVDDMVVGILKGTGQDLIFEINGDQFALIVVIFFIPGHLFSS